ncbi:MAG TPA: MFS transporter, partial [Gemmatirosa sp.]|nr:MFS transporter [Gemmatirosa sp.]
RLVDRVGKGIRSAPRDALLAAAVPSDVRGRAFGFHRAADHLGAVLGPLVAFVLLQGAGLPLRTVFLLAAVPAALAMATLVLGVRERTPPAELVAMASAGEAATRAPSGRAPLGRSFATVLTAVLVFTLGNSTDAFLVLRAAQLGVPVAQVPLLWAMLHVVKSAGSTPGGALADRVGRRPPILAGWAVHALVYLGFARASAPWHAWALFAAYGMVAALAEGAEKALVADLVPADRRGAAFGWYHLAVGLGALPASLVFGVVWERAGAPAAFAMGAALAVGAGVVLALAPLRAAQQQREPGRE